MDFLDKDFSTFIAPDCQRADFIQNWLEAHHVHSDRIVIDGKNHILIQFNSCFYNPQYRVKTVLAHHDRVENSLGANDNSAAVWILMNWAVELNQSREVHNVRIFFTDGEELGWNTGVNEQGAFALASTFKRLGITKDDVYVFDSCGRGEVPVLAKTKIPSEVSLSFIKNFNSLYERSEEILKRACPGRWMTLPVPYSDNASFLACGIPAVAITMLPAEEASLYARDLKSNKNLEDQVMNRESSKIQRMENESSYNNSDSAYRERMPLTWRLFHTQQDNLDSLTEDSIRVMQNILSVIADVKTFVSE